MKKIVGILQPFTLTQKVFVYENGNKIDATDTTIDKINDVVFNFAEEYKITKVDLMGPQQFSKGIGNKLQEAELIKYSKNTLEINYL